MGKEFKVEAEKRIADGLHIGVIVGIEYREKPYEYTDVIIEESESKLKLKVGYPSFVATESKLGNLLARFGAEIYVGKIVDPEKILIGKVCQFMTLMSKGKDGKSYSNIVPESVKQAPNLKPMPQNATNPQG